jgi:hypothetical protein
MKTAQAVTSPGTRRPSAHLASLDIVITATEQTAAHCAWCKMWCWVMRRHLEKEISLVTPAPRVVFVEPELLEEAAA